MLTLTSPVETPLHRLPAGVKLAALAGYTALLFALQAPGALALAGLPVLTLIAGGGRVFAAHAGRMLRPLWPFLLVVAVWHLATGAALEGLAIGLRLVIAVAAANLVTMTTRLSDMIAVIERLAAPLTPVLPPRRLALAIALAIRFVPVLSERVTQIAAAWRSSRWSAANQPS